MVKNYQIKSTKAKHLQHSDFLPERSPFKLIQEEFCTDPWKASICRICLTVKGSCRLYGNSDYSSFSYRTQMLNMTRGSQVKGVVHKLFQSFHDPKSLLGASDEKLISIIKPLGTADSAKLTHSGLHSKRCQLLKRFSKDLSKRTSRNW